jgi:peptide deformylase
MAIRNIRTQGDPILNKPCREVKEMTPRLQELVQDMIETMYEANGVGLAAPQVGILRRIAVIDVGEGPYIFVNPRIIEKEGEQVGDEGCLSVPGMAGCVRRPMRVVAEAFDINMEPFTVEGEGLFARAMCHEFDHLDGHLYTELVEGELHEAVYADPDEEYEEDYPEEGEASESEE